MLGIYLTQGCDYDSLFTQRYMWFIWRDPTLLATTFLFSMSSYHEILTADDDDDDDDHVVDRTSCCEFLLPSKAVVIASS